MRRLILLLSCCLLLPACASDRVPLAYRNEPGRRLEHRLTLSADITRTLQGRTVNQQVVATFLAAQEILSPLPDGGAEATVSLAPESLVVDGRQVEAGPDQEFDVLLAPDGRVVEITGGVQTDVALGPVGIERLLPRLRPVLPGRPVRPGDSWSSQTEFADESGEFSLSASSRLRQLGLVSGHRSALVRTTYESPVDRQETFQNAVARMEGTDVGAQEAWFALDGFLVRAVGDSVGSYLVTFTSPGGEVGLAPVEAGLVVRLHTEMNLVSEGPAGG
ncbi:MAG: hypothetical protein ACRDH9_05095 [Actinomycetota bacterium]